MSTKRKNHPQRTGHVTYLGLTLGLALLTTAVSAVAIPVSFKDFDSINADLKSSNPSYSDDFNIAAGDGGVGDLAGYNPLLHVINSATASFVFTATGTSSKTVTINVGSSLFASGSVGLSTTFSDTVTGTVLLDLQADGTLAYTVTRTDGNFTLVSAELLAEGETRPVGGAVPDGGSSLVLLGMALAGLGWIKNAGRPRSERR